LARFDLGLSSEEFGDLSYAQFEALLDRKKRHDRVQWFHTATLAVTIGNTSGNLEKPLKVEDFLPPDENDEAEVDLTKLSPEQQALHFMNMFSKKTVTRH